MISRGDICKLQSQLHSLCEIVECRTLEPKFIVEVGVAISRKVEGAARKLKGQVQLFCECASNSNKFSTAKKKSVWNQLLFKGLFSSCQNYKFD